MIKIAALKTKEGSDLSGLAADGWRRMLAPNCYGTSNIDWRRTFANVIKKI